MNLLSLQRIRSSIKTGAMPSSLFPLLHPLLQSPLSFSMTLFLALALSLSLMPLAHAEVSKCQDSEGRIVYSDVACVDAMPMRRAVNDNVPKAQSPKNSLAVESDRGQIRETAWTNRVVPASKKSLDKLTIRDALYTLKTSDSAVAYLRQQTLASNR